MDLHLKDKVVLVTGGARGLGRAICTILAQEGAHVAINYTTSGERAIALAAELSEQWKIKAIPVKADVASESEVSAMFETIVKELGPLDALVNNAAYCAHPPCVELELDDFQKCVGVNLQGMFLTCRLFCRQLLARGVKGNVVNISSQAAIRASQTGKTAYDMTKAGICGFTRSLALEMAPYGIVVNSVLPGIMYTDILAKQIDADPERHNKRSPLGRIGQCEEIAQVAVFLASDRASYMVGASVDVSGGLALH